ncbi:nitric oxide-sensing protein NosP [Azospirillum soli]|uniref:nitric oxide-sensing protein NosP n=1 Tax=Azospirillum soli TaxID=1304799 RepID=UPI001FE63F4A|nr:nitric oxide-sensing protein NosP [Azospirillum soli]MBP2313291.1 hypothetical protein [Azospirillum soli]
MPMLSTNRHPHADTDAPARPPLPRAVSMAEDARTAARELFEALGRAELEMALVFCSPHHDREELAAALAELFGPVPVVGCTTAGEITPFGYAAGSLVGIGFPRSDFAIATERIDDLDRFSIADAPRVLRGLMEQRDGALAARGDGFRDYGSFAFLMIDGMSRREEMVVSALHSVLMDIPLFGGSAGDELRFERTFVLHGGRFQSNAAVLMLVTTTRHFVVFRTEHFVSSDRKMVVTGADPQRRIVTEINAEPAGREYARMVGLEGEPLTPMIFAAHPVVVRVGGEYHVRSIQKVNEDESLTFYCAIDEGIVLTVAQGVDPVENFEAMMLRLAAEIGGPPDLVLGCDCILRRLELEQRQLKRVMSDSLARHKVVGFCAYGEQYNAMHVNQTFTGVAIGAR